MTDPQAQRASIPTLSLVFGFGPMLPLAAAALGAWLLPPPWPLYAVNCAIVWGALVLSFIAGVRRGFGFGSERASTLAEIVVMLIYFVIAGVSLLVAPRSALALLTGGYALVGLLDHVGAKRGNVPLHFARLRPWQALIAVASLATLWWWTGRV